MPGRRKGRPGAFFIVQLPISVRNDSVLPLFADHGNDWSERMLVVSATAAAETIDRGDIDRVARQIVLDIYQSMQHDTALPSQARFDAALEAYQRSFPHVAKALAQHAVAFIIASERL
jgi:hypothetical protein